MSNELKQLLASINAKKEQVKDLCEIGKLEEAQEVKDAMKKEQKQFDLLYDLEDKKKDGIPVNTQEPITQKPRDSVHVFAEAARAGFPKNQMSEGSDPDGGYTVPQDIQTQINELRESRDSLRELVTVETVKTLSGSRVFKKRTQQTGFTKVSEGAAIGEKDTPQFKILEYKIEKYAGYFGVTSELLADSDQSITETLTKWIADEGRVTDNKLILEKIKTKAATDLKDLDGIKTALNVTLDPAFRQTAVIVTNQDGFNYLDTLKDKDGAYLLQPNPLDPTSKMLVGVRVKVVSNKDLPSDTTTTAGSTILPLIIGDLKEGIVLFDRQHLSILGSNIAIDAFVKDLTYFRAIERLDVKNRDDEAYINGTITVKNPVSA
ncbi:phage major capsid protein [Eubacterium callanderi]|uniref:phage major capsid protein n=1 Tax=Eubacterium callanderi TaxID=53442 RepID=UPI0008F41FFE|nr:phage major capsid protein [Eubacterium callanderi]SFO63338.1 phage major capsid protein, HK97 family [Eubacterium callanderi]